MQTLYKLRYPDEIIHQTDPSAFVLYERNICRDVYSRLCKRSMKQSIYGRFFSMDSIRQSVLGNVLRVSVYK